MKNLRNNSTNTNLIYIIFIFTIICSIFFLFLNSSISDSSFLLRKAYAHAIPVNQTPAPDSILKKEELPSKVIIDFSERPVPSVSTIQVINEKNERVDNGDFVIIGNHDREAMTTLDTTKLTDGVYTVSWMAQSADDGHIAKGSYVFGIGNVGISSSAITSSSSIEGSAIHQQNYKVQAITSSIDGLIKWPLIISQITVVGIIFSHLFLWESFGKKIIVNKNKTASANSTARTTSNNMMLNLRYNKRFVPILVVVSVVIIISANLLLFLQLTELVPNNNIFSYASIFLSLLQGPTGFLWLIRIITAIVIIVCIVIYYHFIKKTEIITSKTNHHNDQYQLEKEERVKYFKIKLNNEKLFPLILLSISFIAGSISIFANSLTSHNAAVDFFPIIAVFLDWLHFMGVSIWVGGLFYISTILLAAIRNRTKNYDETTITESNEGQKKTILPKEIFSFNVKRRFISHYYLALLLPRFSLIAILSLGIIGISGIYMAWINIHSFNFLFNSDYGHILIIKLISILPLILLGGYHQLKLHNTIVNIASLGLNDENSNKNYNIDKSNTIIDLVKNPKNNSNSKQEKNIEKIKSNKIDIFVKFSKTIKIEALLAIGVLLVASLLTTTSPPSSSSSSVSMNMSSMNEGSHMIMTNGGIVEDSNSMSMKNLKNSSYITESNILNVTTKIEINPFHSGFNTFKITFTNSKGEPYSKISTVRMIFTNEQADIGPITKKLNQISPGIFAITGGYISQPGEWNIAMAAQRPSDYDLNYKFTSIVNSSSSSSMTETNSSNNASNVEEKNIMQNTDIPDKSTNINNLDSQYFTLLAIILGVLIGIASIYSYRKSKQKLRKTIELLDPNYNGDINKFKG